MTLLSPLTCTAKTMVVYFVMWLLCPLRVSFSLYFANTVLCSVSLSLCLSVYLSHLSHPLTLLLVHLSVCFCFLSFALDSWTQTTNNNQLLTTTTVTLNPRQLILTAMACLFRPWIAATCRWCRFLCVPMGLKSTAATVTSTWVLT